MMAVYESVFTPSTYVYLATLCYVLGLLIRNEFLLRIFLLGGSFLYILYYFYVAHTPLWEAIFSSTLIGAANMITIYRIFLERFTIGKSEEMLTLYGAFPNFNPGQFRKVMSQAIIVHQTQDTPLLLQGKKPNHMYLTMTDGFRLERDHQTSDIGSGHFLGEISFLLGSEASATIIAKPGCSYVSWNVDTLKDLMSKKPHIANAVSVLLNKDIALKLAVSFPTQGIP
jgi:hypothetical protein